MCLSIPAKILSIDKDMAKVTIGGITYNAGLQLVDNVKVGEYVLVHSGYVLETINKDYALETLKMIKEINEN